MHPGRPGEKETEYQEFEGAYLPCQAVRSRLHDSSRMEDDQLDFYNIVIVHYCMSNLSNLETALLGLLAERPMHPYEIEKTVVERDMRCWTEISMSSIYKVLGKLEKKMLVDVHIELTEANQAKKVYVITERGQVELRAKVRELVSEVENVIYQVDLGLHNLHLLKRDEVVAAFRMYIESIDRNIECYRSLETYFEGENCPVHRFALGRRRVYLLKAEREWASSFLEEYHLAGA